MNSMPAAESAGQPILPAMLRRSVAGLVEGGGMRAGRDDRVDALYTNAC
jgi:hypothetical protein